jgi:WD40 repeat protein
MTTFSQELQRLAVGMSGSVVIYDIKTGQPVLTCLTSGCVFAATFSPTGRTLAVYTSDAKVCVWYLTGFLSHFKAMMNAKTPDICFPLPKTAAPPRAPAEDLKIQWGTPGLIALSIPSVDIPIKYTIDKSF